MWSDPIIFWQCRDQGAQAVPVQPLPSPSIADGRHLSDHPIEDGHLQPRVGAPPRGQDHRLEGAAQTRPGDAGTRGGQARGGGRQTGGNGRRLSWRGRRGGKRGRGASGKTPIVVAVETTNEGRPHRLKRAVKGFRKTEIEKLSHRLLAPGTTVISMGCAASPPSPGPLATTTPWSRAAGRGPCQHDDRQHQEQHPRHLPRHPTQARAPLPCPVRIPNRRYRLEDMVPRLAWAALCTPLAPRFRIRFSVAPAPRQVAAGLSGCSRRSRCP